MFKLTDESPLTQALLRLQSAPDVPGGPAAVARIDITRAGHLHIETDAADQRSWFRYARSRLTTLVPAEDPHLPSAAKLAAMDGATSIQLLAWRPGRRIVFRVADHGVRQIHKGFRPKRFDTAVRLHEAGRRTLRGCALRAPRLLNQNVEHAYIVLAAHAGSAPEVLPEQAELYEFIGEQWRRFQAADIRGLAIHSHANELEVIDRWASRYLLVTASLPRNWVSVRHRLGDAVTELPAPVLGIAHRDLHDRQFLEADGNVTLLDFDLLCRADLALDPANLLAHLTLRALQYAPAATDEGAQQCGRAFLDGLARYDEAGFWERLRFYQAATFLRLAVIYLLRPRWTHLAPTLTALASRCLDDLRKLEA